MNRAQRKQHERRTDESEIVNGTPIERLIPLFAELACFLLWKGDEEIPLVREQLHIALGAKLEVRTHLALRVVERLYSAGISAATIDALFGLER